MLKPSFFVAVESTLAGVIPAQKGACGLRTAVADDLALGDDDRDSLVAEE
jgi:hypothetical protein